MTVILYLYNVETGDYRALSDVEVTLPVPDDVEPGEFLANMVADWPRREPPEEKE